MHALKDEWYKLMHDIEIRLDAPYHRTADVATIAGLITIKNEVEDRLKQQMCVTDEEFHALMIADSPLEEHKELKQLIMAAKSGEVTQYEEESEATAHIGMGTGATFHKGG